jgi:alkylated DNA repair dioxygenase AlkB
MNFNNKAITITFGDQAENHVGMQQIGQMANSGFSINELNLAKTKFEQLGSVCELVDLNQGLPDGIMADAARVLVIRKGVDKILSKIKSNANLMFEEQSNLDADKKARMYGRVVNKHARHNLCFADFSQEPDYENGLGRVVSFNDVPLTKRIREELPKYLGNKALNLPAEGNYYYDASKTGIGYHGDSERRIVVAVRLGESIPLVYNWFHNSQAIGQRIDLILNHGDIYVMSEKAVGTDWKKKNLYTLRHAAGCAKYTTL